MPSNLIDRVYPERRFGGFSRTDATVHFFSRVRALHQPGDRVLDIGCGRGKRSEDACRYRRDLQNFRGSAAHVLGIDVDPEAQGNPFIDEFRLIEKLDRWLVEDASIDLAFCDMVIEHVEDPAAFFDEAFRVLAPGGHLCLRTPNKWAYFAIVARLVPNRMHAKMTSVAQPGRKEEDVFPTVYRCNTRRALLKAMRSRGFDAAAYSVESEPSYLRFSSIAYRIGAVIHPLFPSPCRATILGFARKPGAPNSPAGS